MPDCLTVPVLNMFFLDSGPNVEKVHSHLPGHTSETYLLKYVRGADSLNILSNEHTYSP